MRSNFQDDRLKERERDLRPGLGRAERTALAVAIVVADPHRDGTRSGRRILRRRRRSADPRPRRRLTSSTCRSTMSRASAKSAATSSSISGLMQMDKSTRAEMMPLSVNSFARAAFVICSAGVHARFGEIAMGLWPPATRYGASFLEIQGGQQQHANKHGGGGWQREKYRSYHAIRKNSGTA
jgi:hypothetical protein